MESGNSVALLEFRDVEADGVNDARDVVALVDRVVRYAPLRAFPVFGVGT